MSAELKLYKITHNGPEKPKILRFGGLPLAGKTTLAAKISSATGIRHLDIDAVRVELFGKNPVLEANSESKQLEKAYEIMYQRAREILDDNQSLIVSATYRTRRSRAYIEQLANIHHASLYPVWLQLNDLSEVVERLQKRIQMGGDSNILTLEDYQRVLRGVDPVDEPGTLILDARENTDQLATKVLSHFPLRREFLVS